MKSFAEKALDFPWGVVCGISAMIAFYGIVAFVGVYVILSGIAEQTAEAVSLFENWYQVLLFAVDVVAALAAAGSLVMYILRKRAYRAEMRQQALQGTAGAEQTGDRAQ